MTSVKGIPESPLSIDGFEPKHLGFLLDRATRRMRHDLGTMVDGHEIRRRYSPLTPSSFRLLSLIPEEGARVTDLATLAGMTKQALGQFVDLLEPLGYVVSSQHPTDRRVRLITRTALGDHVVADVNAMYERLDSYWESLVGPRRWATFRTVITELAVGWEDEVGRPQDS